MTPQSGCIDWQPLIIAGAAAIGVVAPAVATFLVTLGNRRAIARVEQQTNGTHEALTNRLAAIEGKTERRVPPAEPKP